MGPPPPEAKAWGSSDDEEEDHEHYDHDSDPTPQEVDRSPSMPVLAKDDERRVDSKFCIGADEPELHKVSCGLGEFEHADAVLTCWIPRGQALKALFTLCEKQCSFPWQNHVRLAMKSCA